MKLEWKAVVIAFVLMMCAFYVISWIGTARGETRCPQTNQEERITEAITPSDHVWVYEGQKLIDLFTTLNAIGVLQGTPIGVDKVYVIEYKNLYHIFFLYQHCIVDVRDILKSQLKVSDNDMAIGSLSIPS